MKVLTYNIHGWRTSDDSVLNIHLLASVIAATGADLVGLNEVFHPLPAPAGAALEGFPLRLGMSFGSGRPQPAVSAPGDLPYGNALLSRLANSCLRRTPFGAHRQLWAARAVGYSCPASIGAAFYGLRHAFRSPLRTDPPRTVLLRQYLAARASVGVRICSWATSMPWLADYAAPGAAERLAGIKPPRSGRRRRLPWLTRCESPAMWTPLSRPGRANVRPGGPHLLSAASTTSFYRSFWRAPC